MKQTKILGKYCKCFLLILGTVFVTLGILILLHIPQIHEYIINEALEIKPGTKAFEAWRTNEPPLILDIYFFNWTNAADVYNKDIKPNFEQVGPYRFKEVKEKYDIVFHENETVSFKYVKRYYFMEEESPKPLTENITTINPIALTAAYKNRFYTGLKKSFLSITLSAFGSIYVTKSIDELLFTGYEDRLLTAARTVQPFMVGEDEINDKFGWFYKRNNTYGISGEFSMYTGQNENFGKIVSWNHSNRTQFYEGKCNDIHGSAGEFHPYNRERDSIEVYSSEMCTYAILEYERDDVIKGIKGYKYSANTLFDNGTKNPDYACYCNGECIPSGVLNISSCRMDSPIFLSLPHFYNADPYYTQIIDGMEPDKDKHDFYITLEPKSAIVIDLRASMQLNMLLQPIPGFSLYQNVPKILVPVFFFDQVVTASDDLAQSIYLLQNLPEISWTSGYIMIGFGSTLLLFVMISYICLLINLSKRKEYHVTQRAVTIIPDEIPLRINNKI